MGNDGLQYTWLTYCNVQTAIMAFNTEAVSHSVSIHHSKNKVCIAHKNVHHDTIVCYFGVTGHIFVCKVHFIFYSDGPQNHLPKLRVIVFNSKVS